MTICGLDECGRGSLAGPLVAAAVSSPINFSELISSFPYQIRDSKKLSPLQRQKIVQESKKLPISVSIEEISVEDINSYGIGWANIEIFVRLIRKKKANLYIVDGNLKLPESNALNIKSVVRADSQYFQVMLAGILAKEYRDNLLRKLHLEHPYYGWDKNAGYGTREHLNGLCKHGISPLHRQKFCTTALSHLDVN